MRNLHDLAQGWFRKAASDVDDGPGHVGVGRAL